ncbi:MAG: histidine phosphatase family protein [Thiomicrospira sp.]|nr:histidine phosphatase family protein [Thiomicrospira sp.]
MSEVKIVRFVRHAKPEKALDFLGRYDLAVDFDANQLLFNQLIDDPMPIEAIYASPLARCGVLAQAVHQHTQAPLYYLDGLQERDWGEWDGCCRHQVAPDALAAYYADPFNYVIAAAESWNQMRERVQQAWLSLLQSEASHILCVTHGGVMRLLCQQFLGLSDHTLFQLGIGYGAQITWRVSVTPTTPFVELISWQSGALYDAV